jgi:hypothetical protein
MHIHHQIDFMAKTAIPPLVRSSEPQRHWQDVYRPATVAGEVYLKLTVIDEVLIVSFKEL